MRRMAILYHSSYKTAIEFPFVKLAFNNQTLNIQSSCRGWQ